MPLYTSEWISINRQYSTIGITACNQYVANKGLDIKTEAGIQCIYKVLKAIEDNIIYYNGDKIVCEQYNAVNEEIELKNCPNCKERIGKHDIECPFCKYIDDPKYKKHNEKLKKSNRFVVVLFSKK